MKRVYRKTEHNIIAGKPTEDTFGSSLDDWLASHLIHESYDAGSYGSPNNSIETHIQRLATALGKVVAMLHAKDKLTDQEVISLVEDNLGYRERNVEIRE
jgi:hypothetical protein